MIYNFSNLTYEKNTYPGGTYKSIMNYIITVYMYYKKFTYSHVYLYIPKGSFIKITQA